MSLELQNLILNNQENELNTEDIQNFIILHNQNKFQTILEIDKYLVYKDMVPKILEQLLTTLTSIVLQDTYDSVYELLENTLEHPNINVKMIALKCFEKLKDPACVVSLRLLAFYYKKETELQTKIEEILFKFKDNDIISNRLKFTEKSHEELFTLATLKNNREARKNGGYLKG